MTVDKLFNNLHKEIEMEEQERQAWIAGLKVGDEILVDHGKYKSNPAIQTIDRETAHYFFSGSDKIRKKDGRVQGYWNHIRPVTEADRISVERRELLLQIATETGRNNWLGRLRVGQLQTILNIKNGFKPEAYGLDPELLDMSKIPVSADGLSVRVSVPADHLTALTKLARMVTGL